MFDEQAKYISAIIFDLNAVAYSFISSLQSRRPLKIQNISSEWCLQKFTPDSLLVDCNVLWNGPFRRRRKHPEEYRIIRQDLPAKRASWERPLLVTFQDLREIHSICKKTVRRFQKCLRQRVMRLLREFSEGRPSLEATLNLELFSQYWIYDRRLTGFNT